MILLEAFFRVGGPGYYLIILVFMALLVGLYLWGNSRKDQRSRADDLTRKYQILDDAKLAAVPDEEVVEAVAANLMAKLDRRRPDPYKTIPLLSHGRCVVYSVWLVCRELDEAGFEEFFVSPSSAFGELAADGLEEIGAGRCAAVLRSALAATPQTEELAELHADYLEAMEQEQPLALCVPYIRDNAADFVDAAREA